ncbi:MAG: MBL fold metallo-hydrolase [Candidatus Acidiferrales bacterium]
MACGVLGLTARANEQAPPAMQVVLLGTGFPRPDPNRAGPSAAIVMGEKFFIVDAGRGVVLRLAATDLELKNLQAVFLTHLHSDHTEGLPDLFNSSWIFGRKEPLELYGPRGTKQMAAALVKFFAADIHIRRDLTEMQPAAGATIRTHIVNEGLMYHDENLRVTAFAVDHHPVEPAFGYRFESGGKSIVISGDTRPSENLILFARGADILVHEACLPEYFDSHDTPEVAARLKQYHTSAEDAGKVAQAAGVKMLVLTHLVPGNDDQAYLERAGKFYKGQIVVGHDLMRF